MANLPFKLLGLTDKHKDFLYEYAQKKLGSKSRTKAILALINEKMSSEQPAQNKPIPTENLTNGKKVRIQFSLKEHDYNNLLEVAKNTDSSPQHYIICTVLNNIYDEKIKLLGTEIENLKKSNYELHKIGVNINQIARALNSDEKVSFELDIISKEIKEHISIVKEILANNLRK